MSIGNGQQPKQMPVGANNTYGSATGKPESTSVLKQGEDLRSGGK